MVVDSTTRGKRFPDSFSATVPIWCAVMNTIVFQRTFPFCAPPWMEPSSTAQMNSLLHSFVESVDSTTHCMVRELLLPLLKMPFQPIWVCPSDDGALEWLGDGAECLFDDDSNISFTPVIMLSCSPVTSEAVHSQHHSWQYVQGAGDDEESWALGLTPAMFFDNKDAILASDDHLEVEAVACRIVTDAKAAPTQCVRSEDEPLSSSSSSSSSSSAAVQPLLPLGKSGLWIGWSSPASAGAYPFTHASTQDGLKEQMSGVIQFIEPDADADFVVTDTAPGTDGVPLLRIHAAADKRKASSQPRSLWSQRVIPALLQFYQELQVQAQLRQLRQPDAPRRAAVAIVDSDGGTLAGTAALAILLSNFDTSLDFATHRTGDCSVPLRLTKAYIRGSLAVLQVLIPAPIDIPRRLVIELNNVFVAGDRYEAPSLVGICTHTARGGAATCSEEPDGNPS